MKAVTKSPWIVLPIILFGTFCLLYFGALAPDAISSVFTRPIIDDGFVDAKLKYQLVTLAIALLVVAITYVFARKNARIFYKAGNISALSQPVGWLGIKSTDTWKTIGRNFSLIVSVATGIFVFLNIARGQSLDEDYVHFVPFIILFALMNAFTEEAITRLSLVTILYGFVPNSVIYIASALLFGLPHYFGVPGGFVGAIMAAFLGWFLSKSIVETQGLFWAWFIHFLQDMIIFAALFLTAL